MVLMPWDGGRMLPPLQRKLQVGLGLSPIQWEGTTDPVVERDFLGSVTQILRQSEVLTILAIEYIHTLYKTTKHTQAKE